MRPAEELKFTTDQIDVAAAISVATGHSPAVYPGKRLMMFDFPRTEEVVQAAANFAAGSLVLSASQLLKCRSGLYRRMREAEAAGGVR
ncbi:hypothetical protein [Geobacter sp. AOG1]|uniref:hypothetical protein n=1 Tax=Geobacter sp. AOG1 TaxID=1566346 RepID=UPI001CC7557A|nr:hypothetical protein [Geobacter sp. AOG1]GFE56400.1 hypothetical protein AOG1_02790 [Geobacter sp. AOG1]